MDVSYQRHATTVLSLRRKPHWMWSWMSPRSDPDVKLVIACILMLYVGVESHVIWHAAVSSHQITQVRFAAWGSSLIRSSAQVKICLWSSSALWRGRFSTLVSTLTWGTGQDTWRPQEVGTARATGCSPVRTWRLQATRRASSCQWPTGTPLTRRAPTWCRARKTRSSDCTSPGKVWVNNTL